MLRDLIAESSPHRCFVRAELHGCVEGCRCLTVQILLDGFTDILNAVGVDQRIKCSLQMSSTDQKVESHSGIFRSAEELGISSDRHNEENNLRWRPANDEAPTIMAAVFVILNSISLVTNVAELPFNCFRFCGSTRNHQLRVAKWW